MKLVITACIAVAIAIAPESNALARNPVVRVVPPRSPLALMPSVHVIPRSPSFATPFFLNQWRSTHTPTRQTAGGTTHVTSGQAGPLRIFAEQTDCTRETHALVPALGWSHTEQHSLGAISSVSVVTAQSVSSTHRVSIGRKLGSRDVAASADMATPTTQAMTTSLRIRHIDQDTQTVPAIFHIDSRTDGDVHDPTLCSRRAI
jgi:hypothetical protein